MEDTNNDKFTESQQVNIKLLNMLECYQKGKLNPKQLFVLKFTEFPSHHKLSDVSAAKTQKWLKKEYKDQVMQLMYYYKNIKSNTSVLKEAVFVLNNKLVIRLREFRFDVYFVEESKEAANEILAKVITESKFSRSYGRIMNSFLDENVD